MGNMLWVVENGKEIAGNERDAKLAPRLFYKDFKRGRKFWPNGIETVVHKFFGGALQRKPRVFAVSLGSLGMLNMLWGLQNRKEMAENEWDAEPTLRPFYKEFERGRKFGPNGIEKGVHQFFWEALQRKPRACAVKLVFLAMGNMLWVLGNRKEMAENEWDARPTLRPFYKEFERGRKFGPNGIETGVHKCFLGALQRKPRVSAVSLGSLAMGDILWILENRKKMAENERSAKPTFRPVYKEFERGRKFGSNGIGTGLQ